MTEIADLDNYQKLYELKMMQTQEIGPYEVTRVPSGWIFKSTTKHYDRGTPMTGSESMVFVPFQGRSSLSTTDAF